MLGYIEQVRFVTMGLDWSALLTFTKHSALMNPAEKTVIKSSVHEMLQHLEDAASLSSDPADAPPLTTLYLVHTGRPGRPSVYIS